MISSQSADLRWITLRPSKANLVLTLLAPVGALAVVFLVDLPDWGRAIIATAVFLVTVIDVYYVRQRNARAISAFSLESRTVDSNVDAAISPQGDAQSPRQLVMRLRFRFPHRAGGMVDVETIVLPRCYVSIYFTSISYVMPGDAVWRRWFPRVLSIWADSIDAEEFRRVRVMLKWR